MRVQVSALYLAWSLPLLATLAWLMPPWQNPDEPAHFERAVQIAHGGLVGTRVAGEAGGISDRAIITSWAPLVDLIGHPERRVSTMSLQAAESVGWGDPAWVSFPNSAQYPPFLYLPGVVGYGLGRVLSLTVVQTLLLARLLTATGAAIITAAALTLAQRTRPLLTALALLPMTVSLYAAVTQDALLIALALLVVALLDRAISKQRLASPGETTLIAASLALIGMARPPYVMLVPVLLLGTRRLWVLGVIIATAATWWAFVLTRVSVRFPPAEPARQAVFMQRHPGVFVKAIFATLGRYGSDVWCQFIGQPGWLDVVLPVPFIAGASAALGLAALASCLGPARRPWLAGVAVLLAAGSLAMSQYVTWSRPGAPLIDGLQGRYFLPPAAILSLALPAIPRVPWLRLAANAGLVLLAISSAAVTVHAVALRYYLGG